jgi:alkylresorcinol/alkylpyrone synthase
LAAVAVRDLYHRATSGGARPITRILSHAGGKDVLAALEAELPGSDFSMAREILRRHGNMSSPSVLFALAEALRDDRPSASEDWWLTAFGAGFSAHACRLSAN